MSHNPENRECAWNGAKCKNFPYLKQVHPCTCLPVVGGAGSGGLGGNEKLCVAVHPVPTPMEDHECTGWCKDGKHHGFAPKAREKKMRDEWRQRNSVLTTETISMNAIADWWLAQLKSSHLALLEQIIVEREYTPPLDSNEARWGYDRAFAETTKHFRAKIEELKKQA